MLLNETIVGGIWFFVIVMIINVWVSDYALRYLDEYRLGAWVWGGLIVIAWLVWLYLTRAAVTSSNIAAVLLIMTVVLTVMIGLITGLASVFIFTISRGVIKSARRHRDWERVTTYLRRRTGGM